MEGGRSPRTGLLPSWLTFCCLSERRDYLSAFMNSAQFLNLAWHPPPAFQSRTHGLRTEDARVGKTASTFVRSTSSRVGSKSPSLSERAGSAIQDSSVGNHSHRQTTRTDPPSSYINVSNTSYSQEYPSSPHAGHQRRFYRVHYVDS